MYGYGYRYNSGLVVGAGGGAPFSNTYSLSFDGVDDYVSVTPNPLTDFTVSFWINPSSVVGASFDGILGQGTTSPQGGILRYVAYDGTGSVGNVLVFLGSWTYISGTVTNGVWTNIVLTYDSVADELKGYNNGSLYTTISNPDFSAQTTNAHSFERIGLRNGTSGSAFNGNIDEVAVWDSALTDISSIYNGGTPTDLTSLTPIAWYRNGDNGSYKSPQWLIPNNENKDKSNYSFQLDGVDDYINCGNPTDLQITGAFTLSVWTKLDSTVGTQACAISKDNGTSERAFTLWSKIVNKPVFYIWNGATSYNVGGTTNIADDTWHHVAVVYVPSTSIRIYVDGVLEGTNTTSIPASINNANYDFKIGEFANSLFEFKGLMDEVSVFNSAVDIATLYNSGTPTTLPSGAVAHYKMGEEATFSGGVWTVPDNVGSNNGTSNAMTIEDRVGEAPNSENNALSYNMDEVDRVTDTP